MTIKRLLFFGLFLFVLMAMFYSCTQCERKKQEKLRQITEDPSKVASKNVLTAFQTPGIENSLPVFYSSLTDRLTFPLSWLSGNYTDFSKWKKAARQKVIECLSYSPPPVPFQPIFSDEEDRGNYFAQKVIVSISADSRILAYILRPKGVGPFPAVLLLHDHGARFDIGKEKVIRPFNVSPEILKSSEQWITECYGGKYIGDELAKEGYVCLSMDALNWSDRGGAKYEGQQSLASNLFNLGASLAGVIAYEDMRAAEFLSSLPNIDTAKVAAMGLSMGAFRAWQVAALSPHIKAGVAICWMATTKGLMVPGNNHTRGNSAFTMTHPGLFNFLDYPDVASIACPKPMLFFNGLQDQLFPIPSVEEAYDKMQNVWKSQRAESRLLTKLWNDKHVFSIAMQDEAFAWLKKNL